MTGGKWTNAVIHRADGSFRGGVMRTLGGARVDTEACPHTHPTWAEARFCAGVMEAHKAGRHRVDEATCPLCLFAVNAVKGADHAEATMPTDDTRRAVADAIASSLQDSGYAGSARLLRAADAAADAALHAMPTDDTRPDPLREAAQAFLWEAQAYRTAHYNGTHMTADGTAAWAVREREFEKKAKALRAALAASGAVTEGLDVERLARATATVSGYATAFDEPAADYHRTWARRVAAEYARLSGVTDRPDAGMQEINLRRAALASGEPAP